MMFADALKAMRRGMHVHGEAWRTLVLADSLPKIEQAFEEAERLLMHGSMPIDSIDHVRRVIKMRKGGPVRFFAFPNREVAVFITAGHEYTHIIYVGSMDEGVIDYMASRVRSSVVEREFWRTDSVELF